jgi:hypothetical protein
MQDADAKAILSTKTHPRVTEESVNAKIGVVDYQMHGSMTICVITMKNGYKVVGKSAPASVDNFDASVGEHYAYKDAYRQIWPLEGYLLKEQLTHG